MDRLDLQDQPTRRKTKPTPDELKAIAAEKKKWRADKLAEAERQAEIARNAPTGYRFALPHGAYLWMSGDTEKGREHWAYQLTKLLQDGYRDVYGGWLQERQIYDFIGAVIIQDHRDKNVIAMKAEKMAKAMRRLARLPGRLH